MITGWVKNIISSLFPSREQSEHTGQGAQAFEKKAKAKLIDLAEGVYLEEARKKNMELQSMLGSGRANADPRAVPPSIRKKVKGNLEEFYDMDEIMEEITEKISEASQFDPFYKRLFR